ncbi:hypothetical protein HanXRQr2_Chr14g0665981 [Helianthus annuus]|uniref:Uncharacterized protein n=1 Tax=Helianthus annuus TaxID=4232 RepID=A0A9K3EBT7_HELAN|nr:hypothetical protein HanXRQr2_Chr14g0665981 [Helianthus annuus]KAJ0465891.1 hypothetical protein HanHA300_Chr14g0543101 [Helianthus annuus]KAJ0487468.1 hypothetical protein HanHA89_Chr14g0590701 [Helianthus annuus]KAJ0577187.1 hypothetical protein HanIR_Chr05g0233191 [Helianthus annuus]KAJ0657909.1 hypothetical protein HanLR1_Chr14g0551881 [Helianthus annuus]
MKSQLKSLFFSIFYHCCPSPLTNRPPTHCHSRISITMVQCDLSVLVSSQLPYNLMFVSGSINGDESHLPSSLFFDSYLNRPDLVRWIDC